MNSLKYLSHKATPSFKHSRGCTLPREYNSNCLAQPTGPSVIWSPCISPISFFHWVLLMTYKMPNDWHVQDDMLFHVSGSLIHVFLMFGASFLPTTLPTPTPLFTQFLRCSSNQKAVLMHLSSQTPTFSPWVILASMTAAITLYNSYLLSCPSLHLNCKVHEDRQSAISYRIVVYIILFPDVTGGWCSHKCWLTDSLNSTDQFILS